MRQVNIEHFHGLERFSWVKDFASDEGFWHPDLSVEKCIVTQAWNRLDMFLVKAMLGFRVKAVLDWLHSTFKVLKDAWKGHFGSHSDSLVDKVGGVHETIVRETVKNCISHCNIDYIHHCSLALIVFLIDFTVVTRK